MSLNPSPHLGLKQLSGNGGRLMRPCLRVPLQLNSIYWHSKMQLPARVASSLHPGIFIFLFRAYTVTVFVARLNFGTLAREMSDRTALLDAHEKRNCRQWHFSIVLWLSFSSAIFCTGHNEAEMCRVSCSLRLILLKPGKWEKY